MEIADFSFSDTLRQALRRCIYIRPRPCQIRRRLACKQRRLFIACHGPQYLPFATPTSMFKFLRYILRLVAVTFPLPSVGVCPNAPGRTPKPGKSVRCASAPFFPPLPLHDPMSGARMKKYFSRHRRQSGHDSLSEFPVSRNGNIFGGIRQTVCHARKRFPRPANRIESQHSYPSASHRILPFEMKIPPAQ